MATVNYDLSACCCGGGRICADCNAGGMPNADMTVRVTFCGSSTDYTFHQGFSGLFPGSSIATLYCPWYYDSFSDADIYLCGSMGGSSVGIQAIVFGCADQTVDGVTSRVLFWYVYSFYDWPDEGSPSGYSRTVVQQWRAVNDAGATFAINTTSPFKATLDLNLEDMIFASSDPTNSAISLATCGCMSRAVKIEFIE